MSIDCSFRKDRDTLFLVQHTHKKLEPELESFGISFHLLFKRHVKVNG